MAICRRFVIGLRYKLDRPETTAKYVSTRLHDFYKSSVQRSFVFGKFKLIELNPSFSGEKKFG